MKDLSGCIYLLKNSNYSVIQSETILNKTLKITRTVFVPGTIVISKALT